jgi:HSP20 family molecular chaperone IbpA
MYCIELASLPKEKIVVELDGNDLNLSATKDDCVHDQGGGGDWSCNLGERSFGKVRRVFRIPNYGMMIC